MTSDKPMRFAYADPPYFGHGARLYGKHHDQAAEWDKLDTHRQLVEQLLTDYPDGWALSCNPSDLAWLLPITPPPPRTRICVYAKTFHQIRSNVSIQYAWEPLIICDGRNMKGRKPMVRDWAPIAAHPRVRGLVGAKPDAFCEWVLDLLGFNAATDTLTDLFPGTGGMAAAIERRTNQPALSLTE